MTAAPALTPERVLRRLEWRVIRRLDGRLQGDYRTLFRGTGVDVADLREYQPGDDLRHIDWNVTARMDTPHVRDVPRGPRADRVAAARPLAVDGVRPGRAAKDVVLTEVAATVAQLLARGGNRIGAMLFDNAVERMIPPGRGPQPGAADPVPAAAAAAGRRGAGPTDLACGRCGPPRDRPAPVADRDGLRLHQPSRAGSGRSAQLARRHDVVAIQVVDRREFELPAAGMIYVEDAETGEQIFVDTDDPAFRRRLRGGRGRAAGRAARPPRRPGSTCSPSRTDEDLVRALARISSCAGAEPAARCTFIWPWMLLRRSPASRCSCWLPAAGARAGPPRRADSPRWAWSRGRRRRRAGGAHLPPAFFLAALILLLFALARPEVERRRSRAGRAR